MEDDSYRVACLGREAEMHDALACQLSAAAAVTSLCRQLRAGSMRRGSSDRQASRSGSSTCSGQHFLVNSQQQ